MLATIRRWFVRDPRKELLDAVGDASLPTMQPAVLEVLRLLRSPTSTPGEIARVVQADPGLAVRVLRLVNSPAAGLKRRVDSISHAAVLLGRSGLENIVLGVAVRSSMPANHPELASFWRVAAHRAATARALAQKLDPAYASVCFAGGLLQDLALPLLLDVKPEYGDILRATTHQELERIESQEYGWTHADVAGWLAEAWGFPDTLRKAIEGHHGSGDAPMPVQIVAWVDHHTHDAPDELIENIVKEFGVCPDLVRDALEVGRAHGEDLANALAR